MDISGISAYTDYLSSQNTTETKLDNTIKKTDYAQADDDKLMEACQEFEAYFLEMVFKEMEKTVDCFKEESGDPNNNLVDYFQDNTVQKLAETSTKTQGLGLAQTLYEQMKRNYDL